MVITGLNSAGCFCSDMGDVVISGFDADIIIDFTVNRNAYPQSTWSERFRPNSLGEVRISKLGNIAKDYFIPMGLTVAFDQIDWNSFSYNVGIIAIVTDAEDNQLTRFAQQFYYATQKVGLLNSQYKFFYNRYNKRSVHPNQYITVGYNLDEQDFKVGVAFYASGGNLDYFVFDYGQEDNQSILHRIRNLSP